MGKLHPQEPQDPCDDPLAPLRDAASAYKRNELSEASLLAVADGLLGDPSGKPHAALLRYAGEERLGPFTRLAREGLRSKGAEVREAAVGALALLEPSGAAEAIAPLLSDRSAAVRLSALRALGRLGAGEHAGAVAGRLKDPAAKVRGAAAFALSELRAEAFVGEVRRLLSDPDPPAKRGAAVALAKLGDDEGAEALLPLLDDPDRETRSAANYAIKALRPARLAPAIEALLGHESAEIRADAVGLLVEIDAGDARAFLPLLDDDDARVVTCAARALWRRKATSLGPEVLSVICKDPARWARQEEGATLLGWVVGQGGAEQIAELFGHPDAKVRAMAVSACHYMGAAGRREALLPLLRDPDPEVRDGAVYALGRTQDLAAAPAIAERLADAGEGSRLRCHALRALGALRARAYIDLVAEHLTSDDPNLRMDAAYALGELCASNRAADLVARLDDEALNVRRAAVTGLGWTLAHEYAPEIAEKLDDEDMYVRAAAAEAVGALRASRHSPRLAVLLSDREDYVRARAIAALAKVGDQGALDPVLPVLEEKGYETSWARGAVANAAGRLLERGAVAGLLRALAGGDPEGSAPLSLGRIGALAEGADVEAIASGLEALRAKAKVARGASGAALVGLAWLGRADAGALAELVSALLDDRRDDAWALGPALCEALAFRGDPECHRRYTAPITLRADVSSYDDMASAFSEAGLGLAPVELVEGLRCPAGQATRPDWLASDLARKDAFLFEEGVVKIVGWREALARWAPRLRHGAP